MNSTTCRVTYLPLLLRSGWRLLYLSRPRIFPNTGFATIAHHFARPWYSGQHQDLPRPIFRLQPTQPSSVVGGVWYHVRFCCARAALSCRGMPRSIHGASFFFFFLCCVQSKRSGAELVHDLGRNGSHWEWDQALLRRCSGIVDAGA